MFCSVPIKKCETQKPLAVLPPASNQVHSSIVCEEVRPLSFFQNLSREFFSERKRSCRHVVKNEECRMIWERIRRSLEKRNVKSSNNNKSMILVSTRNNFQYARNLLHRICSKGSNLNRRNWTCRYAENRRKIKITIPDSKVALTRNPFLEKLKPCFSILDWRCVLLIRARCLKQFDITRWQKVWAIAQIGNHRSTSERATYCFKIHPFN